MRRIGPLVLATAALVGGCFGGGRSGSSSTGTHPVATRLTLEVRDGHGVTRFQLTCSPSGGTAPNAAALCRAIQDFIPRRLRARSGCMCAADVDAIQVSGVLRGRRLRGPVELSGCSACGAGARASADVRAAFQAVGLTP